MEENIWKDDLEKKKTKILLIDKKRYEYLFIEKKIGRQ